jgi:glucokinase
MLTNDKLMLGLDIGGSSVKYGWGNCQAGLQQHSKIELQPKSLSQLRETVRQILQGCSEEPGWENIAAIGIGTPGTIDRASGRIVGVNPNLPFWVDLDPRDLIPPEIQLPVFYDNDANLMALAEAWLRGSQGSLVGITVGSGIGCGLVLDGKVYHGAHGFALELGHVTSIDDGALCTCGRKGCLEAYASVEGLRRRIMALPEAAGSVTPSSGLSAILRFSDSHPQAEIIIGEGLQILARGISDLIVILDPDRVVIGGGAMEAELYSWAELERAVQKYLPPVNAGHTALEKALVGNRAGVLGAIILASQC